MTERIAAGRKTDPFEDLLLEQARLCHAEMLISFRSVREWEKRWVGGEYEAITHCQRELSNIRVFVDDTTKLVRTAAALRGQRITVIRPKEEELEGEGVPENRNSISQENVAAIEAANDSAENEATA